MTERFAPGDLSPLFFPRSIAHVGASSRSSPGRFNFSKFLLHMRYPGTLYPVNPKYEELFHLPCYPRLSEVPGQVDLAIVAVPAESCRGVLSDLPEGKVQFVVIHTSGFGEIGKGHLEKELLQWAREKGFRVVGPNCMGIYSQRARVGFWRDHWEMANHPGTVGFISQSGGHAVNVTLSGIDSGIRFDQVISLGNQIDVSVNDVLAHMGRDDTVRVIGIYVEEIRHGRGFLELLREIVPKKPVIVWKGGVSAVGREAAMSHTGALAGDEKIFGSVLRQTGAISVNNMHQMLRLLRVLQPQYPLPGGGLAFFSPGGGNTVNVCDHFAEQPHLRIPRLSSKVAAQLKTLLPEENVDVRNPVDPGATGLLKMDKLIQAVALDEQVDTLVLLVSVDYLSNIQSEENRLLLAEMISTTVHRMREKVGKPIYILLRQERQHHEDFDRYRRIMIHSFEEKKIPWIDGSFPSVAEVFSKMVGYHDFRQRYEERRGTRGGASA
jgi:acyl-CoA synthetase (NDP forming)